MIRVAARRSRFEGAFWFGHRGDLIVNRLNLLWYRVWHALCSTRSQDHLCKEIVLCESALYL